MRAIILAAGKGSRLNGTARLRSSSYGEASPKCLVELGGVSLIQRQIRVLRGAACLPYLLWRGRAQPRCCRPYHCPSVT